MEEAAVPPLTERPIDKVLSRLDGVRSDGSGWTARCPCREDDDNPSLHVGLGETDDRVLLQCHRGGSACNLNQICKAMNLNVSDLFPEKLTAKKEALTLTDTYPYHAEDGTLLFQKLRFIDGNGKKTFRQRKPDGKGGWNYSLGQTPKVLYNLPEVRKAVAEGGQIWVVEGEKDVETLRRMGVVATTMPGGAGKWLPLHTEALLGAGQVIVVADHDPVGLEHAESVLSALRGAGIPSDGLVPPNIKDDVSDVLGKGGDLGDLLDLADVVGGPPEPEVPETPPDPFIEVARAISVLADRDLKPHQKVAKARSLLDGVLDPDAAPEALEVVDWLEFSQEEVEPYDWLIPGLLERQDRVIVVATEGAGKTTLARQIAILTAYGLHPFTRSRIRRLRTLTIDLENPERIIRRKTRDIFTAAAKASRESDRPDAGLVIKPSGLNLLASKDRLSFENLVEEHRPDVLFLGPLYKAFIDPGGRTSESVAVEVIRFLDYIRETYDVALWMEQHAPLGGSGGRDLRPFGSAVWSRWPEFGIALEPDLTSEPHTFDVKDFRGARDERQWPLQLRWGKHGYPWDAHGYRHTDL